jgi:hypothetical protein
MYVYTVLHCTVVVSCIQVPSTIHAHALIVDLHTCLDKRHMLWQECCVGERGDLFRHLWGCLGVRNYNVCCMAHC